MIPIKDWMSSPVITVSPESSIVDAAKIMAKKSFGCLVVTREGGKLAGIVTERDIITRVISVEKDYKVMKVVDIMTKDVKTVTTDATILEVSKIMNKHHLRRIIVIENGKVEGIVTARDIIALVSL